MNRFDDLPKPTSEDLERSIALSHIIRQEMDSQNGSISFSRYMDLALYHPKYGYYAASPNLFGAQGDFTTAPEISPLFAHCFAKQIKQMFEHLPSKNILELGAGSGRFANDLLSVLINEHCSIEHYYIYEKSSLLKQRQQSLLSCDANLFSKCIWLDDLPDTFEGIIIANEVLDALPVDCFKIVNNEIKERSVSYQHRSSSVTPISEYQFNWQLTQPTSIEFIKHVSEIINRYSLPNGYESEINLTMQNFIVSLINRLTKGFFLFADYGYGQREYYRPERHQGTLTCFYKHRTNHDPFLLPGLQDITAHVDFTRVAEIATEHACSLAGFTTQTAFLIACGLIDLMTEQEQQLSPTETFDLQQAVKLLTLPNQMGERIKIMAFCKQIELDLLGFKLQSEKRNL